MGKIQLQQFYVLLDKKEAVYWAGEIISGRCVIVLNGQLDTSQLEVKLEGMAEVKWSETRTTGTGNNRRTETVWIRANHPYLNFSYRPAHMNTILSMGEYSIPFAFQLPTSSIASSFEGMYGSIKYWIEAIIHKPGMLSLNHRSIHPLFIFVPPCVSMMELEAPVQYGNEKSIGCFSCFTSEFVNMTARIEHVGQTLGTSVSILCTVENKSRKRIIPRVTLKQKQIFHARGRRKWHEENIIRADGTVVEPGSSANEALVLQIPHGLPILYNQCPIIEVNYCLTVTLDIPGSFDLHVDLPVILTNQSLNLNVY